MKEHGIATSLDFAAIDPASEAGRADWLKILENVMPYVDFTVPSFEELCFMLNRPRYQELTTLGGDMTEHVDMEKDVAPMAQKLIELGAGAVLIKCGTSGMYYQTSDAGRIARVGKRLDLDVDLWTLRKGFQPCFKADRVLSATGAGDTSIAAFLKAMLDGKSPETAAALASAEGACAVTTYDALSGLLPLDQLQKRIDAGW